MNKLSPKFLKRDEIKFVKSSELNDLGLNYIRIPVRNGIIDNIKVEDYTVFYKYKMSENFYLICYGGDWGNLNEHCLCLGIYNVEKDKIISKLKISQVGGLRSIKIRNFDGNKISLQTVYGYSFIKAKDSTYPYKDKLVKEEYIINKDFLFEKL